MWYVLWLPQLLTLIVLVTLLSFSFLSQGLMSHGTFPHLQTLWHSQKSFSLVASTMVTPPTNQRRSLKIKPTKLFVVVRATGCWLSWQCNWYIIFWCLVTAIDIIAIVTKFQECPSNATCKDIWYTPPTKPLCMLVAWHLTSKNCINILKEANQINQKKALDKIGP